MMTHKNDSELGPEDPDDVTNIQEHEEHDYSKVLKVFFAPYHPHARKMFKVLKKLFNINCVHKKTTTLLTSCLKVDLNLIFGALPTLCTQYLPMTRNSNLLATPKGNSENEYRNVRLHAKGHLQFPAK